MEKGIVVNEYKNGTVKKFVTATGYQFEAFIPNNCNVDTSIIMYEHGDYGYYNDWKSYTNKFSSGDCNSIIIRADRNNSIDLYNHIVKQYNLTENQRMTVSFSGGDCLCATRNSTNDKTKSYCFSSSCIYYGWLCANYAFGKCWGY